LLKPRDYNAAGCIHEDIDLNIVSNYGAVTEYQSNLRLLMSSTNDTQYKRLRLETGIVKPSILLGIPSRHILGIPTCFSYDIMHFVSLSLPDILINLWRGTLECDKSDNRASWDWAVLQGNTWKTHGESVAATRPFLPGSFDRAPRNPAEKINSGYKAWEFLLYIFVLGPGLFYGVLPEKYWKHFCKLIFGIRILHQHKLTRDNLRDAHKAFLDFALEFELLYCQRHPGRLHFVRPCIHALIHAAPEVYRVGPALCSSQWTMERAIGDLAREIRQPSNPFANLSQRGLLRCQLNALKAIAPELQADASALHIEFPIYAAASYVGIITKNSLIRLNAINILFPMVYFFKE
jgi:hypothetical protein